MRSRILFFTLLLALGAFVLPLAAHAAETIPFFGPIVPANCPAGWGLLVTVINNIIIVLLSIMIVFFAPLMIAYAGFLFVVNPTNAGWKEQAKKILTNTIVGIIISLSAWMIVGAIMAALYHPESTRWGTWQELMVGGGSADDCIGQLGSGAPAPTTPAQTTPPITVVPPRCSFSAPPQITDSLAQQMEALNGNALIWTNTKPQLKKCVDQFIRKLKAGGVVASASSAYRPPAYQQHLYEINQLWCSQGLKQDTTPACSSLKRDVQREMLKHFKSSEKCGPVAPGGSSNHAEGTAIDMSGINNHNYFEENAAKESCLDWKDIKNDPWHYELISNCPYTCQ